MTKSPASQDSPLLRGTVWMLLAHGGRLLMQTLYFILLSRALGVYHFGVFAGMLALISIGSPFSGWGSGSVLVMHVSREPRLFPQYWAHALRTVLVTGLFLGGIGSIGAIALIGSKVSFLFIVSISASELLFARLLDVSAQSFQAFDKLHITALLQVFGQICRLLAALVFWIMGTSQIETWGLVYLSASGLSAVLAVIVTCAICGLPSARPDRARRSHSEGFYFSLGLAAKSLYADIDKTMLLRLVTADVAGVYAAAYRVINVSFAPIQALLAASYSRFFRMGQLGPQHAVLFARRLLSYSVPYGIVAGLGLFFLAPVVPMVLGPDYSETVSVIQWLAGVPLLQGVHYMAADAITGVGRQKERSILQIGAGLLNVGLNLWLIPQYAWKGAAWATLASELFLGVTLWTYLGILRTRETGGSGSVNAQQG